MEKPVLKTVKIKVSIISHHFRSCSDNVGTGVQGQQVSPGPQEGWNKLCLWLRPKLLWSLHICTRHCSLLPAATGPWHINECGFFTPALSYLHVWALKLCRPFLPCTWLLWNTGRADTELFVPILIVNFAIFSIYTIMLKCDVLWEKDDLVQSPLPSSSSSLFLPPSLFPNK